VKNIIITETRLSRIWKYIENDSASFGVISPFRKYLSMDENLERYKELKSIIKNKLKLGYIELEGGFKEEGDWVNEKSLFIPNITKEDLISLGENYDQYSVIYKDRNEFVEIGTNDMSGKGSIVSNFKKSGWDENMQINTDLTNDFFSKLARGSHRGKKFLFNIKETFLFEVDGKTFNDMYRQSSGRGERRVIKLL
jgi:hypothetical protein